MIFFVDNLIITTEEEIWIPLFHLETPIELRKMHQPRIMMKGKFCHLKKKGGSLSTHNTYAKRLIYVYMYITNLNQ